MDLFQRLFDGSLMPHGQCLLWRPDLLTLHVGGDLLTVLAYFAIPPAILIFNRQRDDLGNPYVLLMFSLFIFLCGLSHLMGLANIWNGYYFLEGVTKIATGIVSLATCIAVWRLLPHALELPSNEIFITNAQALAATQQELADAEAKLADMHAQIAKQEARLR